MYSCDWRYYPDRSAWLAEADLWYEGEEIDPDEQEFQDAFDALVDMPAHEIQAYAGAAWDADANTTLEV